MPALQKAKSRASSKAHPRRGNAHRLSRSSLECICAGALLSWAWKLPIELQVRPAGWHLIGGASSFSYTEKVTISDFVSMYADHPFWHSLFSDRAWRHFSQSSREGRPLNEFTIRNGQSPLGSDEDQYMLLLADYSGPAPALVSYNWVPRMSVQCCLAYCLVDHGADVARFPLGRSSPSDEH